MRQLKIKVVLLLFINFMFMMVSASVQAQEDAKQLTPVTLQLMWKHQFEFAGFYAAIEQGFYEEVGLDVQVKEYEFGQNLVDEVVQGKAQYGVSDSSLIIDRNNGAPVVLLVNLFQHSPMVLLTLADSKIYSPAQMVGKRIMLSSHEKNNASITAMLNSESVSLDQLQIKEHSFNVDDLIHGNVDIISSYATNEPGVLLHENVKFNIIDPINYGIDFYGNNIFTSEKELREHPQRVDDFIKASLKGWRYALDHPGEVIELILAKYSTQKSREALTFEAKTLERFILPNHIPLGTVDLDRMERIVDTYKQLKMLPEEFELDGFIYQPAKVNNSIIKLSDEQRQWVKHNRQITLGVDPAWPPFEFLDQNGNYSGMAADYIQLISKKTGLNFVVQDIPTWQSVMEKARSGQLDLLAAVMKSPQRAEFLDFSVPHIKYPMVILTQKDDSFISGLEQLKNKQVAVVNGYVTEDLLRTNHPGIILKPVKNLEQALKLLSSGEVDALVDNLASVSHTIHQLGISNVRISGTTPYEFALGFAVQKGNKVLLDILQKALDDITDQEHQMIRNKWISVKYAHTTDYVQIINVSIGFILLILFILFWNRRLAREVKARIIVEDALRNSEAQFRNLVENTNIIAWEVDVNTMQFTYISPQAELLLGYPLSDWKKQNFWVNHIAEENKDEIVAGCINKTIQGIDHTFEYRMLKADGSTIWLRDIITVNKDVYGKPISLSGVFVDIDEGKKHEQALEKAKLEAEQANNIKSEFLATMSHELRTPMNGVLGMAQLLNDSPLTTEQHEAVKIILLSGNSLLAIINDVLDFSKLEAEQVTLEAQSFNLEQLGREILDMFRSECQRKELKMELIYPQHYPRYIVGDRLRFQQILMNLIGNAVKFTFDGHVNLIVFCQPENNQRVEFTLTVEDTGIGIALENTEFLFDPFIQADQSTTRKFGGTGLGLAVCNKLVELMGGEIGVDSELGKGSRFWVNLKLPIADEQNIPEIQAVPVQPDKKLMGKILLVEDDKINQMVAVGILRKVGLDVDLAENGEEAINLWQQGDYDLIFMDCRMPVMDGYEATIAIRQQEIDKNIPIIALTANSSPEDNQRCIDAGMNDVVTKPFKTDHLLKCLNLWLVVNTPSQEKPEPNDSISNQIVSLDMPEEPALDQEQLDKFRLEMGEDFNVLLDSIMQGFDTFLGEFAPNLEQVTYQNLANSAHSLQSKGAHIGAKKLGSIAAEIEKLAGNRELNDLRKKIQLLKTEYDRVKVALAKVEI